MRAALIVNRSESDPGFVGASLSARGYDLVPFVREDHASWSDPDGFDLVVSFGSAWSTYWDEMAAPIRAEQELMARAIGVGIPVLGLCFGGQQLSTVLDGVVTKAQTPEIGWFSVEMTPESTQIVPDGLFHGPWMQWHYDRFTVPEGATCLAETSVGPQAFVHGRCLGLQFHPEATRRIVEGWSSGQGSGELVDAGIDRDALLEQTTRVTQESGDRCDAIVEWFLSDVAQGHIREP